MHRHPGQQSCLLSCPPGGLIRSALFAPKRPQRDRERQKENTYHYQSKVESEICNTPLQPFTTFFPAPLLHGLPWLGLPLHQLPVSS